ncbi:MAG: NUDIX hydrolase [Patescibacteria group bacterium]
MKIPKTISSNIIYTDSHIRVNHDVLEIDSFSWNQVYLEWNKKNTVCIIPYENNGVYLIRQYRHAVSQHLWQFPGGLMEPSISEVNMARKELLEEAGFSATKFKKLGTICPEPGLTTENVFIYLATGLQKKKTQIEKSEIGMELKFFPITTLKKMISRGKIHCGITLSTYLLLDLYLTSQQ